MNRRELLGSVIGSGIIGLGGLVGVRRWGGYPDGTSWRGLDTDNPYADRQWFSHEPFVGFSGVRYAYEMETELTYRSDSGEDTVTASGDVVYIPGEYLFTDLRNPDVADFWGDPKNRQYDYRGGYIKDSSNGIPGLGYSHSIQEFGIYPDYTELMMESLSEGSPYGEIEVNYVGGYGSRYFDRRFGNNFILSGLNWKLRAINHKQGDPVLNRVGRVESAYEPGEETAVMFEIESMSFEPFGFSHNTDSDSRIQSSSQSAVFEDGSGTVDVDGEVVIHDDGIIERLEYTATADSLNGDYDYNSLELTHRVTGEFGDAVTRESAPTPEWVGDLMNLTELDITVSPDMIRVENVSDKSLLGPIHVEVRSDLSDDSLDTIDVPGTEVPYKQSRRINIPYEFNGRYESGSESDGSDPPGLFWFEPGDVLYVTAEEMGDGNHGLISSVNEHPPEEDRVPFRSDGEPLGFESDWNPGGITVCQASLYERLDSLDGRGVDIEADYDQHYDVYEEENQLGFTKLLMSETDPGRIGSE